MTDNIRTHTLSKAAARPTRAFFLLLLAGLASSVCAHAALIEGILEGPNSVSFADGGVTNCTGATTTVVAGFTVTSNGAACLPFTGGWNFGDNGQWFTLPALTDNSGTTTITINLGGEYSAVWGWMNYYEDCSDFEACVDYGNDPTITALDKNMNVLETEDIFGVLSGSSSGDIDFLSGSTVGLTQTTADIAYLQIGGDFIAMTDISVSGAPEPATLTLSALALAALCLLRHGAKRRNRSSAVPISR